MSLSRYQLERTDLIVEIEQGRKVEREQFAENHLSMRTMGELLWQRNFNQREAVLAQQRRDEYVPLISTPEMRSAWVRHGIECPCDGCLEAVKRLLIDCGVLPRGKRVKT